MPFKTLKKFLPLGIIALLMGVAWLTGLHEQISLASFHAHKAELIRYVSENALLAALAFMGLYVAAVALSLPIATLLTLTGGFFFGKWLGTVYVVSGATIGASIIFLVAKTSLGETLRSKAGGIYQKIEKNMKENAFSYLLFLRLVPVFPFFLVNIVPALFNVPLRVFVLTTFLGIIPGSFVFVNLGQTLGEIKTLNDLVSGQTLVSFGLLGLLALLPTLYKQFKARKKSLTALAALLFLLPQAAQAGRDYDHFLNLYDGLLKSHVHPAEKDGIAYNGVDYAAWRNDIHHRQALTHLLAAPPENSKAYWINAYNFLTIDLIIKTGETKSIKNLGSLVQSPWKKHSWEIGGAAYTLDQIEHDILRPMGDARIHFAINCASVSCPDLRIESYRAGKLDMQLNQQVTAALANEGKGVRLNGEIVYASRIFDWFSRDFKNGDVKGWLSDHLQLKSPFRIEYMDYDWSLNSAQVQK